MRELREMRKTPPIPIPAIGAIPASRLETADGHDRAEPCPIKCFQTAYVGGKETLMSKGAGKVERAIEAAFAADPDNAFTTDELCQLVYSGINSIEKKHRVAVVRSAKSLSKRASRFSWLVGEGLGGRLVFFDCYNVMSYAMARLKVEGLYEPGDTRYAWKKTEADMRAQLAEGGRKHRLIVKGGAWRRHVEGWIAERDGDHETVARLEAESARILQALGMSIRKGK